jgi:predicted permease
VNGLTQWIRRRGFDEDLSAEIREHLEEQIDDMVAEGLSREQAVAAARRRFGNITRIQEVSRDVWRWRWLEHFFVDVRYGLRILRGHPGFATVVVLTLALGIGANTAVFSVMESVLVRPLPFHDPERLVVVWAVYREHGPVRSRASGPEFQDYKEQNRSFESLASLIPHFTYTWTGAGEPRTVNCTGISHDFFPMLGVQPYMGRLYTPDEYHVDGVQVVISQRFWKEQLGGDPKIIGRVLNLDGTAQTVVGVMPPVPDLFPETDIWAKLVPDFAWMQMRGNRFLTVVGRLRRGASPGQASRELTAILHRGPGESPDTSIELVDLMDEIVGPVRSQLKIVMAAVTLVLLIACVNVAYLLLARSSTRQSEIAVRLGMGASRGRVLRQLIAENLVLAGLGGAAGTVLAAYGMRLVRHVNPGHLPRGELIAVDSNTLTSAVLLTIGTSVVLAWAPSVAFSKVDLSSMLRIGRSAGGTFGRSRFRVLLVSEASLAIMLLVGAGLLLRSFWEVQHVNPGFRPDHVLTAYLRTNDYATGRRLFRQLLDRTAVLNGVHASAVSDCVPAAGARQATLLFDDRPNDPDRVPAIAACWISPDFFRAVGTPLLEGRAFTVRDDDRAPQVVIVNRALADTYWPGQNPVGKHLAATYVGAGRGTSEEPVVRQVVGVVANMMQTALDGPVEPAAYMPYLQDRAHHVFAALNVFVRTAGDPRRLAGTVRAQVHAIQPDQPVDKMQTLDDILADTLAPRRVSLVLFAAFAALALLLSAIGIFGMMAYSVGQRTRELGLRIAFGATRCQIVRLVMKDGVSPVMVGIVVGSLMALVFTRTMSSVLFHVTSSDPLAFGGAIAVLIAVAGVACLYPAWRATRVDPMIALRYE